MVSHFTPRLVPTSVIRSHPVMEGYADAASLLATEEQRLAACESRLSTKREQLRKIIEDIDSLEQDRTIISLSVAERRKTVMSEVDSALTTRQQMVDNKSLLDRIKCLEHQLFEATVNDQQLKAVEHESKPTLGAEISEARRFNLEGVWVISTVENSPSRLSGLLPGDVIYEWNDTPVVNRDDLKKALTSSSPNEIVYLSVIRSDSDALSPHSRKRVKVTLGSSSIRRGKPQQIAKNVQIKSTSPVKSPTVM